MTIKDNRQRLQEMIEQRHVFYKETFETPSGKKVLDDLEDSCYLHRSTITDQSSVDPHQIAFREGQRSVILKIKNFISDKQLKQIKETNGEE